MGGEAPGPARASSPRARAPAAVPRMGRRCHRHWVTPPSWALASQTLRTRACPRSSKRQREGSPQTRSPQTGWRPQIRTARTLQGWAVPGWAGPGFRRATPLPGSPAQPSHDPRPTDSHRSRHSHGWNCEGPGRGRCTAGHTQAQLGDWLPQAANRSRAGAARWWEVGPAQRTARSRHAPGPREHRQGGQMDAARTGARGSAGLCGFGT